MNVSSSVQGGTRLETNITELYQLELFGWHLCEKRRNCNCNVWLHLITLITAEASLRLPRSIIGDMAERCRARTSDPLQAEKMEETLWAVIAFCIASEKTTHERRILDRYSLLLNEKGPSGSSLTLGHFTSRICGISEAFLDYPSYARTPAWGPTGEIRRHTRGAPL